MKGKIVYELDEMLEAYYQEAGGREQAYDIDAMKYRHLINDETKEAWMESHYGDNAAAVRARYLKVAAMAIACVERIDQTGTSAYSWCRKDIQKQ